MADKTIVVRAVYRSNVAQGMRQDAGAISGLSASVESSAGKSANAVKAMGAASAIAGKLLVLGIGGAMAVSAKAAIDFESSMAGVQKTTDMAGSSFEENSGSLYKFGEALRQMALTTPINVNDLAKIAELGGQLGVEVPNLLEFTRVMAELGVSTNLTAEEAATGFARFANIMRTPQDEFRRLGSVVVELGNNLATTEAEILKFGTRIAPIGRIVGMTEEEVFALSGAMSSLGVPAERGGTAIQKWMILAKEAVDSGGESLDKFAKVAGMTSDEFATLFRESPAAAFNEFARGLDRLNTSGGNLFGTLNDLELGEVRTTQALLAAAGGVEVLDDALRRANEQGENYTALQEEAARRFGTTASQVALLGNAFRDLQIEIGNAILGSGGLAFAVDVAKEFFSIIGDNLDVLGKFAAIAGVLVALRIGMFFGTAIQKAQEMIGTFQTAATAVGKMATTAKIAQGAMIGLNVAMNVAIGVAGLLATAWAFMAINAAQARAEFRQLNEEIENGADPVDAFVRQLTEALSPSQIRAFNDLGFSMRDLVEYMMEGKPAASALGQAIERLGDTPPDATRQEMAATLLALQQIDPAIRHAEKVVGDFFGMKRMELTDAAIEAGKGLQYTTDQLDSMAESAIKAFGYDINKEEFVQWLNNAPILMDEAANRAGQMSLHIKSSLGGVGGAIGNMNQTWQDWLAQMFPDDAGQMIESFTDSNIKAVQGFASDMNKLFEEVGDTVRDGFPVWDEYEQVVLGVGETLSSAKVLGAQQKFLEDQRDFITRLPDMMDMGANVDTIGWLESLDAPIRGAIGRLNDAQLEELIEGANRNFDELNALHQMRWLQVYPDNANLAFAAMVGEMMSRVDEMNLPGEMAAEAYQYGFNDLMATMPEQYKADFLAYLVETFPDSAWAQSQGFYLGGQWIDGLKRAMMGLAAAVMPTIDRQSGQIKQRVNDYWQVSSPSKWWEDLGTEMTAGLKIGLKGMDNLFSSFTPDRLMPEMAAGVGAMSTVNNSRSSTYNLTVNGGGIGNNLNAEAQTLLTLLTIVGGVEAGAGK